MVDALGHNVCLVSSIRWFFQGTVINPESNPTSRLDVFLSGISFLYVNHELFVARVSHPRPIC